MYHISITCNCSYVPQFIGINILVSIICLSLWYGPFVHILLGYLQFCFSQDHITQCYVTCWLLHSFISIILFISWHLFNVLLNHLFCLTSYYATHLPDNCVLHF